ELFGSEHDTPLFAEQNRRHTRTGVLASTSYVSGKHTIKGGVELTWVAPNERFTFAVTDPEAAQEHDISDAALAFDKEHPFVFSGKATRNQASCYLQDDFSVTNNFNISAGLRYDYSRLLESNDQWSPRIGAVYHIDRTSTALRASFD